MPETNFGASKWLASAVGRRNWAAPRVGREERGAAQCMCVRESAGHASVGRRVPRGNAHATGGIGVPLSLSVADAICAECELTLLHLARPCGRLAERGGAGGRRADRVARSGLVATTEWHQPVWPRHGATTPRRSMPNRETGRSHGTLVHGDVSPSAVVPPSAETACRAHTALV